MSLFDISFNHTNECAQNAGQIEHYPQITQITQIQLKLFQAFKQLTKSV